jgi:predicted Ser/Thr protein kinase
MGLTPDPEVQDRVRETLARALGTHFRVVRLLGRGGMGAVYLAHETGLDREVAIKVLPPERASTEADRERFRREARTAARLSHPNIVPLHAFGEHEDTAYYVMGYVRGESLATRLRREGPLPEDEARRILVAVADALQYAHTQGVVHRDVKPDNVLLEEGTGRPLLTDFGIARAEHPGGTLTVTGAIVGTPDFMSPEQAAGRPEVGPASDVYSLGVTAYALLSGRLPFEVATPGEALARRLVEDPTPLRSAVPQLPEPTAAAVMRCLARDPARRWPDAASFARALAPPDPDDEVPRTLRPFAGHGLIALVLAYYAVLAHAMAASVPRPGTALDIAVGALPVVAGLFLVLPVLGALGELRHGRPAGPAFRAAFLEPALWATWYPRWFRRAANVWDRLPRLARRVRVAAGVLALLVCAFAAPGWFFAFQWDFTDPRTPGRLASSPLYPLALLVVPASFGAVAVVFVLTGLTLWLGRRLGLEDEDASLFILGAPLSKRSFWSRPAIAALLAPAGPSARPAGPTASLPDDVAAHWPEGDAAPVPRDAAVRIARQAAQAVAAHERHAARLKRDFDPEEAARLARRLESLADPAPDEPPDQAQLRDLLSRQLDLSRDAQRRTAEAGVRRDRLRERLAALRDEAVRPALRPEARRGRLDACLRALQAELAADSDDTPTATRHGPAS